DAGLIGTSAFASLVETLGESRRDKDWFLYSGVHPNPVEKDVREAADQFRRHGCDAVIAIGGGSPLDAGQAAPPLLKRPELEFTRFYDGRDGWSRGVLIAIRTTAGTGREVGRSSVIPLDATHRKAVLFHPELLAKLVILDPALTMGLPPKLTAATGADA